MRGFGLLLLRAVVGVVFVMHGLPKLLPLWGGSPAVTAALFESVGLTPAYPLAVATGIVEVLAGLLLVGGAYTAWVAALLAVTTAAVGSKLHLAAGPTVDRVVQPGMTSGLQLDVVLIGTLLCLLLTGPGALSVDARRRRTAEADAMGRARLRTGRT